MMNLVATWSVEFDVQITVICMDLKVIVSKTASTNSIATVTSCVSMVTELFYLSTPPECVHAHVHIALQVLIETASGRCSAITM